MSSNSLQGNAVVLPAYESGMILSKLDLSPTKNHGQPIRYLISAPTMRVPSNVAKTTNAYLAFRAVLRAGMCLATLTSKQSIVSCTHTHTHNSEAAQSGTHR